MVRLVTFLESESCRTLVLALLHTLWQGCLAAGLLCLYLKKCPAQATGKRYGAGVVALAAIVLAGLVTWSVLNYTPVGAGPRARPEQPQGAAPTTPTPTYQSAPFVVTPSGVSPNALTGTLRTRTHWQTWAMGAWLAGVAIMLVRTGLMLMSENRLRRRCARLFDERILSLVEQLRKQMRISRRIGVYVSERISVPGVVGCLWPALLLPASAVSGIPVDDLRAVLIHELAHIKRYDYLVNFCQMVVEALLFFNPAVWWISRQIRIEREACCDAAGVALAGPGVKYAEALVAWAQRLRPSPAAATISFVGPPESSNLLDRIKRLTLAGHRPPLRLSWPTALAMIALSALCLAGCWKGTNLAVTAAARILTPQERIDKIAEVSKEYGRSSDESGPKEPIEISGIVRTWNSTPIPSRTILQIHRPGWPGSNAVVSPDGTFHIRIPHENTDLIRIRHEKAYLVVTAEGYAPVFAGPFEAKSAPATSKAEFVLSRGFTGRIRLVDEGGQPVRDANVTGGYTFPTGGVYWQAIHLITDANGMALLDNLASHVLTLNVAADGFEATEVQSLVFHSETTQTIVVKRTPPTTGVVLSEATGSPVEGAEVHILRSTEETESGSYGETTGRPDTTTDAQGRFSLNRLRRGCRYLLFIRAPGYGYRYVRDVEAGQPELTVLLGAKKVIRGKVIGDLSLLSRPSWLPGPTIGVVNEYQYPGYVGTDDHSGTSPVTIRDGVGYFAVDDFWGQTVTLVAGDQQVRLQPDRDSLEDIVIKLDPPARRQVTFKFRVPAGAPPIAGQVQVRDYAAQDTLEDIQGRSLPIVDNQATFEITAPGRFGYGIPSELSKRPVGYWFDEVPSVEVLAGEEPYVVEAPVHPAGVVYGKISRADGSMAENAQASVMLVKEPKIEGRQDKSPSLLYNVLSANVNGGTFNATPLPLGGEYAMVAYEEGCFAMSDVFSLDDKNPVVQTNLRLPQGVDVQGRLLDCNGLPARSIVNLRITIKRGDRSWDSDQASVSMDSQWTCDYARARPDENGRFVFKNVTPGPGGTCSLYVTSRENYQPLNQTIENLRVPVTLRLEKGFRVTGTVIDDATGLGVPGVEVLARDMTDESLLLQSGPTDDQGQFVFSNLAQRRYELLLFTDFPSNPMWIAVTGGQDHPVVMRIHLPANSKFKSQRP